MASPRFRRHLAGPPRRAFLRRAALAGPFCRVRVSGTTLATRAARSACRRRLHRPAAHSCDRAKQASYDLVRRRSESGQLYNEKGKVSDDTIRELCTAGYWGILIDPKYGGQGAPFQRFTQFLTRLATQDSMIAGLA